MFNNVTTGNGMASTDARIAEEHQGSWYDVVVIGGGAAGLAGALALVRFRRAVLVIDGGKPRNAPAAHMHNYLSRDGTSPLELLAIGRAEVSGYGGQIVADNVTVVERVDGDRTGFKIDVAAGTSVYARRLLVATGAIDELPSVPGIAERWGRDVIHCPYCHGWEVQDQAIGILATNSFAAHSALMFSQLSADVIVFQHTAPPLSAEQAEQLTVRGVKVIEGEVAAVEIEDDRIVGVRLCSGELIHRQAIVAASRPIIRVEALSKLGLETSDIVVGDQVIATRINADANGATNVPGVWAAGNITDPMGQVISAATAGLKAGAMINMDLINEDTAQAVAVLRAQQPADVASV